MSGPPPEQPAYPALRDLIDRAVVDDLGRRIAAAAPSFDRRRFGRRAMRGLDALPLMARSAQIADALSEALPADFAAACAIVVEAMGDPGPADPAGGSTELRHMPCLDFVARHGLSSPEAALPALAAMTRHFSAEFAIRPFIVHHRRLAWPAIEAWAADPDWRLRRLASEGTRPRLPWGTRLKALIDDPAPVIALLDGLHDDRIEIVRRSVANNLNDIAKDHPALAVATAARWVDDGGDRSRDTVRRGLRTLVKHGDADALSLLGFAGGTAVRVESASITPAQPRIGEKARLAIDLVSHEAVATRLVVDFALVRVLARGGIGRKVFKLTECELAPGARVHLEKTFDFRQRTTRTYFDGPHAFVILVNGREAGTVDFGLRPAG